MANLKDIRIRISSVKTTRQVTSAMKMVSAAKFKKSHDHIFAFRPYENKMNEILKNVTGSAEGELCSEYTAIREPDRILVVAITSNRGLCGAFNSNIARQTEKLIKTNFKAQLSNRFIDIIAIGKQGQKLLKSHGFNVIKDHNDLFSHLSYNSCGDIVDTIIQQYKEGRYDRVFVVYNEFVNAAVQNVSTNQFLPLSIEKETNTNTDFIFEPDQHSIIRSIIPKALKTKFYRWILESVAAEHGARMTSMHKATDNASELLFDLQLMYNKARQSAITNEILEIVGGAEALKSS